MRVQEIMMHAAIGNLLKIPCKLLTPWKGLGPERACYVRTRVGLYTAGSGFCGPGLVGGLWVWPEGLTQKPGPRGFGLLRS
jgi:hypothetical protein